MKTSLFLTPDSTYTLLPLCFPLACRRVTHKPCKWPCIFDGTFLGILSTGKFLGISIVNMDLRYARPPGGTILLYIYIYMYIVIYIYIYGMGEQGRAAVRRRHERA